MDRERLNFTPMKMVLISRLLLKEMLLAMTVRQSMDGLGAGKDLEYRAGYAAGFRGAVASLDSLLPRPELSEDNRMTDQPTDDLAWMTENADE